MFYRLITSTRRYNTNFKNESYVFRYREEGEVQAFITFQLKH